MAEPLKLIKSVGKVTQLKDTLPKQSDLKKPSSTAISKELLRLTEGGGEVGKLMGAIDWSQSPVGPFETWPQSLRTTIQIMLGSKYSMWAFWGKEMTMFYNNAYVPMLGKKHPDSLGKATPLVWSEIWDVVGPMLEPVITEGKSVFYEELQLILERKGFREETYFTFSYGPIPDDTAGIGGMFCACFEDTAKVLARRRISMLRELSESMSLAKSINETLIAVFKTFSEHSNDLPFALIYLMDSDGPFVSLKGKVGLTKEVDQAQTSFSILDASAPWPFARILESRKSERIDDVITRVAGLQGGPWPEPSRIALVVPIPDSGKPSTLAGFLIAGVSPRLEFDKDYKDFLELSAGQIATGLANARAYEEEKKRAEALAEIDRVKTAFFSNVSHEFRTPLTLMLGPLEDILNGSKGQLPKFLLEDIELIQRNALRLLKLVNTLLDFSRIEAGRLRGHFKPTDVSVFTAELASSFRSLIERAGLKLIIDCPSLSEPIYLDHDMWEKVILNLLSNAFKFTFEGEIKVSTYLAESFVEVKISDTGIGIASDQLARVFERFHRVQGARGRSYEGSGIGLALVKELIALHGGNISVTSTVDKGSIFTIQIPRGSTHLSSENLVKNEELHSMGLGRSAFILEAQRWVESRQKTEAKDSSSENNNGENLFPVDSRPAPSKRARILLADDNADMRDYLIRVLGRFCIVEAVGDGQLALERILENPPDLVLTDVMMPNLDGFGLLRRLRENPNTKTIPVIMLSAKAGEEAKVEGLGCGADDYLVKPFSARELVARVEAALSLVSVRNAKRLEELEKYTIELARSNSELEAFAYVAAHDLQEPLRAITMGCQQLAEKYADKLDKEGNESINFAVNGAIRMRSLIRGLLDYSRIQQDEHLYEKMDLNLVLKEALSNFESNIHETGATIEVETLPQTVGNPIQIKQLFENLIGNALKFRHNIPPVIKIGTLEIGGQTTFYVKDNGIGIDEKYFERIFVIFQKLHGQSSYPGSGIGLTICKKVVERHNGHIWVESKPGQGTTFYFTLQQSLVRLKS